MASDGDGMVLFVQDWRYSSAVRSQNNQPCGISTFDCERVFLGIGSKVVKRNLVPPGQDGDVGDIANNRCTCTGRVDCDAMRREAWARRWGERRGLLCTVSEV